MITYIIYIIHAAFMLVTTTASLTRPYPRRPLIGSWVCSAPRLWEEHPASVVRDWRRTDLVVQALI